MNKDIPFVETIPLHWSVIPNRYLFYYDGKKVGEEHEKYQLLSLTTNGVKERDINAAGGKVPASYDNYQTVKKGQMVFCLFDLDCSAVFSGISNYDGMITSAYDVFSTTSKIDKEYADYWFKYIFSNRYYKMYSKNIRYTITSDLFRSLKTPVPPMDEQKQIGIFLREQERKIDVLIANVQEQIEKLKAYKQSLITEVVTKGLDPNVPMKDSGVEWIGVVPKHWVIIPSKFLFENCDERRRENDVQLTASQKYGMISQKEYMRRENARIVLADKGLENWKHIEPFDFVISLRSFQGGLEMSEVSGCATWHYIVLRAQQKTHPYYYKWLFKSSMYITALQRTCNYIRDGQDLRYSNFVKVPLCIPALEEQKQIADYLDKKCSEIDELIAVKQTKIEKLEQYKSSLIYEYVTGKKEVS